jgi:ribonuclease G
MTEHPESLLIEVSPGETRVAMVDDRGRLLELLIDRVSRPQRLEGIYNGRVVKVEKGMGAAFVDIGIGEQAFLDRAKDVHEGQSVVVQVSREAAGGKLASVRRRIDLVGRYMVYSPEGEGIHWPRSLKSGRKRSELEPLLAEWVRAGEGWALRSMASSVEPETLHQEIEQLRRRWTDISEAAKAPCCMLPPPGMVERLLRDRARGGSIIVDDRSKFLDLKGWANRNVPDIAEDLIFHDLEEPIFEAYGILDHVEALHDRRLELSNGIRITFDATEALNVIDVDMGSAGGRRRSDDAILSTNIAAAAEIPRQIRLRNLAGLIVVDFITMRRKEDRRKLVEALKRGFRGSSVPVDVLGVTAAGLVEITRRRDGPPMHEVMAEVAAPTIRLSGESLACQALRDVLRAKGGSRYILIAEPGIYALFSGPLKEAYEETVRRMGGGLTLVSDPDESGYRVDIERRGKE